ncbi:MAG: cytochrome oxidase small assembly protein [Pseudomonadota bacterium]
MTTPRNPQQQGKANLRLALVLASVALVFFAGFVAKIVLFGR